ncbi:unnamed protein product [marine sediment metagenome]|uniref:Uncharacterized protein n=1 Tax=marine sediment metagenome TaxID=412755 RepID=X1GSD6_9ZZZZ
MAKNNQIAHARPFPIEILDWIEFPQNCELLIFNSQVIADKSGAKKDIFNERILAYDIGFYLIKNNPIVHRRHKEKKLLYRFFD